MTPANDDRLSISLLTREYPPSIYGGAGVHVAQLVPQLRKLIDVDVQCMGEPREGATAHAENYPAGRERGPAGLRRRPVDDRRHPRSGPGALSHLVRQPGRAPDRAAPGHPARCHGPLPRAAPAVEGRAARRRLPAVVLGRADRVRGCGRGDRGQCRDADATSWTPTPASTRTRCTWCENGIDTEEFAPDTGTDIVTELGIDLDRPTVVFVGRITRQKGLIHLVRAAEQFDPETQVVLLAGAPDTPEIAKQVGDAFAHLQSSRGNVLWIEEMLPRAHVRQVLSHATVFACPSVYEPLGIVNLEAMACETAVVASAVGGIPEVVVDGETGYLVPYDPAQADDPAAIAAFEEGLATKINSLTADPDKARQFGLAGRQRCIEEFSWAKIAARDRRRLPPGHRGPRQLRR